MNHKQTIKDSYWKAVESNDVEIITELLPQTPGLVNERYVGEALKPHCIWSNELSRQIPTPPHFLFSNTALHTASLNSNIEIIELLIRYGADLNDIDYEPNKGLTPPIVLAAWEGSIQTLQLLLEKGADPNIPASAESAVFTAAEHGAYDKVDLLLRHGARHDIYSAIIMGQVDLVNRMLKAYPPIQEFRSL